MVPVNPRKHIVADGQKLHDSFIKMEIFKPFKQVSVPRNHKKRFLLQGSTVITQLEKERYKIIFQEVKQP